MAQRTGWADLAVRADDGEREFIEWSPAGNGIDLRREVVRLSWALPLVSVPEVIDSGVASDGAWMVTAGLPGDSAVSPRWISEPSTAVTAIGEGLRALHDALPVRRCPFTWSAEERLADAHLRADRGQLDATDWHEEHSRLSLSAALRRVGNPPPVDALSSVTVTPALPTP